MADDIADRDHRTMPNAGTIINRLKRLEGQIRGLQSMIEVGQVVRRRPDAGDGREVGAQPDRPAHHRPLDEDVPRRQEERTREEIIDEALEVFLKYVNCVK